MLLPNPKDCCQTDKRKGGLVSCGIVHLQQLGAQWVIRVQHDIEDTVVIPGHVAGAIMGAVTFIHRSSLSALRR